MSPTAADTTGTGRDVRAYLTLLGLPEALTPDLTTLRMLHHRHLELIPYDNLEIMLGRPPSTDPVASMRRLVQTGRGGYCFHQNGVLERVLRALGYSVHRRHGQVWSGEQPEADGPFGHLVLLVDGLPSAENPGGWWWPDVGLGEGFYSPLPLRAGTHSDGPLEYRLLDSGDGRWSLRNDPSGSFTGIEVTTGASDAEAVTAAHRVLSIPPDGHFARLLVAQRRNPGGVTTLRGCVLTRTDAGGTVSIDVTAEEEWRGALEVVGLSLRGIEPSEISHLFRRSLDAHREWDAAGRP